MPDLLIDASLPETLTGIWEDGRWLAYRTESAPALEAVFAGAGACLAEAGLSLGAIERFIHCEGPGATLGLRVSAMAFRTWRALPGYAGIPQHAYTSLEAAATALEQSGVGAPFHVVTEYRREQWHCLSRGEAAGASAIRAVDRGELGTLGGAVYHLPARKAWHEPPERARRIGHHPLAACPGAIIPHLRAVEQAEVFAYAEPAYVKWSGRRHGAGL